MLIGLCGPHCAGKNSVANYLVSELGFTSIGSPAALRPPDPADECKTSPSGEEGPTNGHLLPVAPSPQLIAQCWKRNINVVIRNIEPYDFTVAELMKRPYFILVYVDAPLMTRFQRAVTCGEYEDEDLSAFVWEDDRLRFETHKTGDDIKNALLKDQLSLAALEKASRLKIFNTWNSIEDLFRELRKVSFTDVERMRPSWDTYFMSLARLAAQRTNCMKRRVGCVIAKNRRMVATGYNGTPSGVKNCSDGGCARCNGRGSGGSGVALDLCLCLHAEENAIIEAGRERCEGGTLYTNLFPCILCAKKIVQSGIRRVVFDSPYETDGAAGNLLRAGKVIVDGFERSNLCTTLTQQVNSGSA